jgi:hypothetical protein
MVKNCPNSLVEGAGAALAAAVDLTTRLGILLN